MYVFMQESSNARWILSIFNSLENLNCYYISGHQSNQLNYMKLIYSYSIHTDFNDVSAFGLTISGLGKIAAGPGQQSHSWFRVPLSHDWSDLRISSNFA